MSRTPQLVALDGAVADLANRRIRGEREARLSPTEAKLLGYLAARPRQTVRREELLEQVWGYDPASATRTLYVTMQRLRTKVEVDPSHPLHLRTVGREGYRFEPPITAPLMTKARGWARPLDRFVGRQVERERLTAWLFDPSAAPQLYLHGPAGIGKTRLVAELVLAHEEGLREVRVVSLASCQHASDLWRLLGSAVGIAMGDGVREQQRFGRVLTGGGASLLVLDDADALGQLLVPWLARWTGRRPKVVVIARRGLGTPELQIGPLSLESPPDALSLWMDRARARWPRWVPDKAEESVVQQVVERLHGSPLAIELTAASAVAWGPLRLQRMMARAEGLEASAEAALEACVHWAWQRLSPAELEAVAALSVFEGAFSVEAAEKLLDYLELELDSLSGLLDQGVLQLRQGQERLLVLPMALQTKATEALGAAEAPWEAHARVMGEGGSADAIEALIRHGDGRDYRRLRPVLPNLLVASAHPSVDGAQAGRLACAMLLFDGANAQAHEVLLGLCAREGLPGELAVWCTRQLGETRRVLGRVEEARETLRLALSLARTEAPQRVGSVLHTMGVLEEVHGPPEAAEALFEEAMGHHVANGDRFRQGLSQGQLATLRLRMGRPAEAETLFKEALGQMRGLDCPVSESIYLGNLAVAQLKQERFEPARHSMEAALELARSLGAWRLEVSNLSNLGLLESEAGHLDAARRWFVKATAAIEQGGDLMEACIVQTDLAAVALRQGQLAEARQLLDLADAGFSSLQLVLPAVVGQLLRSALHRAEGDATWAHVDLAKERIDAHQLAELGPWWHGEVGLLALVEGDRPRAERALEEAMTFEVAPRTAAGRAVAELRAALQP